MISRGRVLLLLVLGLFVLGPACSASGGDAATTNPKKDGGGATGGGGGIGGTGGADGGNTDGSAGDGSTCIPEEEVCDGKDNDCNGVIDDNATDAITWYEDKDGDGWGISGVTKVSCTQPTGYAEEQVNGFDCNDDDPKFHPGAPETDCSDPNDYNCDGSVGFTDADQDGSPACQDCDDKDKDSYPGATEICDGKDNDCNGSADAPGGEDDVDKDGSFSCEDCDDNDGQNFPGNTEKCDGQDNDCNGQADAAGGEFDKDGDGSYSCADCDDNDKTIYDGAAELCDGKDNNCNGQKDELAPTWYVDCDADSFAPNLSGSVQGCDKPTQASASCNGVKGATWTAKAPGKGATDCWDLDADAHPYTAANDSQAFHTVGIAGAPVSVDFDYNCDGKEEQRYTTTGISSAAPCTWVVSGGFGQCTGPYGWTSSVAPACGKSATYTSCSSLLGCSRATGSRTQECR